MASFRSLPSTYDNTALYKVYIVLSILDRGKFQFVQIPLYNNSIAAIAAV